MILFLKSQLFHRTRSRASFSHRNFVSQKYCRAISHYNTGTEVCRFHTYPVPFSRFANHMIRSAAQKRRLLSKIAWQFSIIYIIKKLLRRLIIFCVDLKITLRMIAGRTDFRSLCSDYDMTAVTALPYLNLALCKYLRHLHIF